MSKTTTNYGIADNLIENKDFFELVDRVWRIYVWIIKREQKITQKYIR